MRVSLDIPDGFDVISFTLVGTDFSLMRSRIKTFTHCCALEDGKVFRIEPEKKEGYRVNECYED